MRKSSRLFEIIQIMRSTDVPLTAQVLSERLEVSPRTIYRDIAALQAMRTPIEGEAGIGYVMRSGYDLPPLNFDHDEVEALRLGLSMLVRTGDSALLRAADRVRAKIDALSQAADWLEVAPWGASPDDPLKGCVSMGVLRQSIRDEVKLTLIYCSEDGRETKRQVRPLALIYHLNCNMLAAWCELRGGFRHFRLDRISKCRVMDARFEGQGPVLREVWRASEALSVASTETI